MKPLHFFFVLVFFLLHLGCFPTFSQQAFTPIPAPGELWGKEGLILGTQDPKGYMWFGAIGLHRYDGYNYISYFNDPVDSTSLGFNRINALFADRSGKIWVGTNGGGLDRLDPETGIFTHFRHDPSDTTTISDDLVSAILEDQYGMIWVGTEYGGLNCLDPETGKIRRYMHDPTDANSLSNNQVRALYEDRDGTLWVGTGFPFKGDPKWKEGGLNRFNPSSQDFTRYLHDPKDSSSLIDNRIWTIYEDSKGNFWVGSAGDGLHIMDRDKGTFERLQFNAADPNSLSRPPVRNTVSWADDFITFIREDVSGILWIGTFSGGLNRYDPKTGTMDHYSSLVENSVNNGLIASFIWSYTSKDGVLWISGWEGVFRMDPLHNEIPYYTIESAVTSMLQGETGELWLGTGQGLLVYDSARINKKWFVHEKSDKTSLSDNRVLSIVEDRKGEIWIGTEIGLNRFNTQSENFTRYFHNPNADIEEFIKTNVFNSIFEDRTETLWLGGYYHLSSMDRKNGDFTFYGQNQFDTIYNTLTAILENRAGYLWIGSWSGLKRLDKKTNTIRHHLPGFTILSIFEDSDGVLWIGTNRGLYYFNAPVDDFELFTNFGVGLTAHINVFQILEDDQRSLWINTSIGIFHLRHNRRELSLFGKNRMTPSAYGTQNGCFKGIGGELFFGDFSGDGYFAFFPDELKTNTIAPDLHITAFRLGDQLVVPGNGSPLSENISRVEEIRLSYNENAFSFEFAGIHYSEPDGNQHFFMLENADNDWRKAGEEKTAYYTQIPPGDYVFRVKASNSDGVWAEKSMAIIISPPWWRTWWAYFGYILFIGGSIYTVYNFQLRQRLQQAEALRLKELDAVKTKLYTNITHEFRTPLTVILGVANQVLDSPKEHLNKGLKMIMRNGQNLLTLVNQMLDLNKLESGKLSLQYHHADIVSFLGYIIDSFHALAENKGIQIHFISVKDQLNMDFDEVRLQQIFSNIISNAIKFTPKGGHVYVSTDTKNGSFILKIKDTGIGISDADIPHIFDRFYQADDSHTRRGEGTGIGLALTHELVKLMKGTIAVTSKEGQGSEFEVTLPTRTVTDSKEETNQVPSLSRDFKNGYLASIKEDSLTSLNSSNHTDNGSPHVLVVDDNEDVLAFVASCLENEFAVEVAKNGQECEEMAFQMIPDLIVMDVMMPFKDGFEACKTLKTDERTSHIPIILLTAKADLESRLQGLEQGADDYLTKPFHKKELLLRIKNLLDLRRQLQQHYLKSLEDGLLANSLQNPNSLNNASGINSESNGTQDSHAGNQNPSIPIASSLENAFVVKVRKTIELHLEESDFDVEKLCRSLALSHSQVHRKLSALTGLSATHFIRYVRLIKAKEMILKSGFSMTAIAYDCGFNEPAYFSRIFKQEFGMSPQVWREQNSRD